MIPYEKKNFECSQKKNFLNLEMQFLEFSCSINFIKEIYKLSYTFFNIIKRKNIKITICFVHPIYMKNLNLIFRNNYKTTDIISFPYIKSNKNEKYYFGDIILCPSAILEKSKKKNISFLYYFQKILLHGFLHLLGYDHKNYVDYKLMYTLEKKIFLKIKN